MNTAIVVLLAAALVAVSVALEFDERKVSPYATICMQRGDKCSMMGQFKCCRGLTCQSSGMNGRRCQQSGNNGGIGGMCMEQGTNCSLMGRFTCCRGLTCQSSGMGGRRRCRRSGNNGGIGGNCIQYGNRCNMSPSSRRCCMGQCRRGMNGRSTCM